MTDESRFEARLERALRDYAEQAVASFDAASIADDAIQAEPRPSPWLRITLVASAGVAAVVVVAVVAAQLVSAPLGIGGQGPIHPDELPAIVANSSNTSGNWDQTLDQGGEAALRAPMRSTRQPPRAGFVDARTTEMCGTDADLNSMGCLLAWVALYETVEQADAAYEYILDEFASADGWALPAAARSSVPGLGNEAVLYTDVVDPANQALLNGMYFWRDGTLLMAVVGIDVDALPEIAQAMQTRAE